VFYHHPHLRRSYVVRRDEGDLLIVEGRLEFNDVWWAAHHLRKGLRTYPQGVDMVVAALEPLLDTGPATCSTLDSGPTRFRAAV